MNGSSSNISIILFFLRVFFIHILLGLPSFPTICTKMSHLIRSPLTFIEPVPPSKLVPHQLLQLQSFLLHTHLWPYCFEFYKFMQAFLARQLLQLLRFLLHTHLWPYCFDFCKFMWGFLARINFLNVLDTH